MKRTKEQAEETRQQLLDTAVEVFHRVGYAAARLDDIADEAGVTRGAIYHHFGSKAGLLTALIEDASAIGGETMRGAIAEGGTIAEITHRILVSSMHLLEENRRYRIVKQLSLLIDPASPELQPLVERQYQEAQTLVQQISGVFQMGMAAGNFRETLDPATGARALLAFQNGLALLWLANPDAFSIRASASELADVFMQGVRS